MAHGAHHLLTSHTLFTTHSEPCTTCRASIALLCSCVRDILSLPDGEDGGVRELGVCVVGLKGLKR